MLRCQAENDFFEEIVSQGETTSRQRLLPGPDEVVTPDWMRGLGDAADYMPVW